MTMHAILAEKTVSISDLRAKPASYFTDEPVAVLSNNRPAGYVIGAETYRTMMNVIREYEKEHAIEAGFRPTAERLREIGERGAQITENATEDDLGDFTECP